MNDMHDSPATPDRSDRAARTNGTASAKSDQAKTRKPSHATSGPPASREVEKFLAITLEIETANVVRIEGVDSSGTRRELSTADREVLLNRKKDGRVEDFVEQAFEAGLACVLDDDPADQELASPAGEESVEEAELRHRLLAPLIDRCGVRRLTERAVLDRAILNTLIDHAAKRS